MLTIIEQDHVLLLSREIIVELTKVLRYPHLQALYGLTDDDLYNYVLFLHSTAEIILIDDSLLVPIRDPKDVAVLRTAVTGGANIICTLDTDFSDPQTLNFCTASGIEICSDVELLRRLRQ